MKLMDMAHRTHLHHSLVMDTCLSSQFVRSLEFCVTKETSCEVALARF